MATAKATTVPQRRLLPSLISTSTSPKACCRNDTRGPQQPARTLGDPARQAPGVTFPTLCGMAGGLTPATPLRRFPRNPHPVHGAFAGAVLGCLSVARPRDAPSFFIAERGGWSKDASASGNALGCLTREVRLRPQEGYGDTLYLALPADMTPSAAPGARCGSLPGVGPRSSSVGDPPTGPGDLSSCKTALSFRSITQPAAFQTARQKRGMPRPRRETTGPGVDLFPAVTSDTCFHSVCAFHHS